jgi:hypothetical protein
MSEEQQTLAVRCSPQKADTFEDDTIIRLVAKMDGAPTDAPYIAFTAFDSTVCCIYFNLYLLGFSFIGRTFYSTSSAIELYYIV